VTNNLDYSMGFMFLLVLFILTWAYDTGAYTVGIIAGRHKLIPSVSPGKTLEGTLGGLLLAVAAVLIARKYLLTFLGVWESVFLAFLASMVGQLGDLVESMIKRDVKAKDSSTAIPGHGGILDRFDSMLFNAPVIYYMLKFFILE
jgi:phosphatidate cytidylyltransferase